MHWNLNHAQKARELLTKRTSETAKIEGWLRLHSRDVFANDHLQNRDGHSWCVREYQRQSLNSYAFRKVHCDGRDVGKTTEIELIVHWASVARPNSEMLIAAPSTNHLYPLMKRIVDGILANPLFAGNVVEVRPGLAWHVRFKNGFVLWGRIAETRGVNFQGMHVDWLIVDEAQEMTEAAWGELYQSLNGGGRRWVYGVPDGRRETFYRMSNDTTIEQYNWPSTLNPNFDTSKDLELALLYGGKQSPGYLHRVLGQHGAPEYGVFDLDRYFECIDRGINDFEISIAEDDDFAVPEEVDQGEYYLGCDLGYARDPSEFVVYRVEGPTFIHTLRVHLEGVNYARQMEILMELDKGYSFAGIGIDCGNSGRAVAHNLMEQGPEWCEKVRAYEFGGLIELAPLPDGRIMKRRIKEFMTELIVDRINERTVLFPACPARENQYASQTYSVGEFGRIVYSKGNDHIIDADRCAHLRWYEQTQYEDTVPLGAKLIGF